MGIESQWILSFFWGSQKVLKLGLEMEAHAYNPNYLGGGRDWLIYSSRLAQAKS
jgi:hypothetical protein